MNLKTTLIALTALAAVALAPAALGQNPNASSIFGQTLKIGDWDYTPVAKGASFDPVFAVADFGTLNDIKQFCILLLKNKPSSFSNGFNDAGHTAATATIRLSDEDLRLVDCPDGKAGTRIGKDLVQETKLSYLPLYTTGGAAPARDVTGFPTAPATVSFPLGASLQVADANANNKYDVGDCLYVTTKTTAGLPVTGVGATVATSAWSVRLTACFDMPAGAVVLPGDSDFVRMGPSTKLASTANLSPGFTALQIAEREDKAVFVVPTGVPRGGAIPINSVRLGPTGQAFNAPNIQATKIELASSAPIEAGKSFNVVVTVTNGGSGGGVGLLVTRVDSAIVDARLSMPVSAGASDRLTIPVTAPCSGSQTLKVNDGFLVISVAGDTPCAAGSVDTAALDARLRALESKAGINVASAGAPGLAPVALLAVLALGATVLRRRGV